MQDYQWLLLTRQILQLYYQVA